MIVSIELTPEEAKALLEYLETCPYTSTLVENALADLRVKLRDLLSLGGTNV